MKNPNELTKREKEIVNLVGKGKTHKEITDELKIKESTLNTHLKNIHPKTNTHSMAQLALWARDNPDKLLSAILSFFFFEDFPLAVFC
ncbi:MAG: response regulator transcription factor [Bacteroidia bacterium]